MDRLKMCLKRFTCTWYKKMYLVNFEMMVQLPLEILEN